MLPLAFPLLSQPIPNKDKMMILCLDILWKKKSNHAQVEWVTEIIAWKESKNAVCACQITYKLLSFTLEDS